MRVAKLPPRLREQIERWTGSRSATRLTFEPNGEGALDMRLDGRLIGQMWVEGDELHISPVKRVAISKGELRNLIDEAIGGIFDG